MKKIFLYLSAAVLMVAGCTKNNPEPEPDYSEEELDGFLQEVFWDQTEVPDYKVLSEQILTPEEMADFIFGAGEDIDSEALEAKNDFLKQCDEENAEWLRENPDEIDDIRFRKASFEYHSIDHKGRSITLSAFIGWKVHSWGKSYDQDHIYFCCPYTHTKESECATKDGGGWEFRTMLTDNLFIMPDGQGFGSNANHTQTYLNHNLHALQYYAALKVGYNYYLDKGGTFEKDWTLGVFGASQGAGDAIALHKYLDTHFEKLNLTKYYESGSMADRLFANAMCIKYGYPKGTKIIEAPLRDVHKFDYSFVCCGPYCPEVTMRTYRGWEKMSYPCVIPLVIKSMLECYPDELKYDEKDFFSGRWNQNKAYFDGVYLEKTMNSAELNLKICEKLGISPLEAPMMPLSAMLSDEMLDTNSQIYKDLMSCLRKNDLTSGWTPKTKTKLLYSETDEVVPYANTQQLRNLFKSSGCTYQDLTFGKRDHVDCCHKYITYSWYW